MSQSRADADYVQDMLDAAEKAEEFVSGMDFAAFEQDEKTIFAIVRALEIIGEASNHISEELQEKHPEAPWFEMRAMRNKIVHDYMEINADIIWDTVQNDLPALKPVIKSILGE